MKFDAIVVGAGFAGMYMLYRLREMGLSVRVLEAADGVGGTWYWNRYPGARCDVQSLDYSYSFSEELQQEWEWSEKYATQPEILRYANHVADRFDLRRDIAFETRVTTAAYDATTAAWAVTTDHGDTLNARYYIVATGCLSVPKHIDVPGADAFAGATYHTADWPRDGVDFSGQRVAVIGTGSSAIQTIPIVAEQAAQLSIYQRTPAFSQPARNRPLDNDEVTNWKANYAKHREASRHSLFGVPDYPMTHSALEVDDQTREQIYENAWEEGTLIALLQSFNDLLFDPAANATAADFVHNKIRSIVKDAETAEALCPSQFPIGTKRACLDSGYYETFNLPHVELVDLRKTPIETINASGIRTSAGQKDYDAIIFATGFDAMTGAIVNVDIRGLDGIELRDKWQDGPRTYLGLGIAGFPNLFTITGPGSPSVMSNMMLSIEQHVDWIAACIEFMRENDFDTVEATGDAEAAWVQHVNEVADATLFPQANSWYMGANVPGKPRVFMPYIGGVGPYRQKCDEVAAAGYEGFHFASRDGQAASAG